jgi:MoxR-like ATPase
VLTFEEVAGMFAAKEVDFNAVEVDEKPLSFSSADGRGFAVSGGVAKAVVNAIHKLDPEREVKVANAQGLDECVKLLRMAKAMAVIDGRDYVCAKDVQDVARDVLGHRVKLSARGKAQGITMQQAIGMVIANVTAPRV